MGLGVLFFFFLCVVGFVGFLILFECCEDFVDVVKGNVEIFFGE